MATAFATTNAAAPTNWETDKGNTEACLYKPARAIHPKTLCAKSPYPSFKEILA